MEYIHLVKSGPGSTLPPLGAIIYLYFPSPVLYGWRRLCALGGFRVGQGQRLVAAKVTTWQPMTRGKGPPAAVGLGVARLAADAAGVQDGGMACVRLLDMLVTVLAIAASGQWAAGECIVDRGWGLQRCIQQVTPILYRFIYFGD